MTKDKTDSGHLHAAGILEKVNKICSPQNLCFHFKLGYLNLASARVQILLNFDRTVPPLLVRLIFRLGRNLNVFRN